MTNKEFVEKQWGYKKENLTKEKILEIAKNTPIVYCILSLHDEGEITWEEALMYCVMMLNDALNRSQEDVEKLLMQDPMKATLL